MWVERETTLIARPAARLMPRYRLTVEYNGGPYKGFQAQAALPSPPDLKATVSKKGLTLSGPRTFAPGRITLSLKSVGNEREIEVVSFKPGFTFSKLRADIAAFGASEGPNGPSKAGIKPQ